MNVNELWKLREYGLSGFGVRTQQSNFWSKHNRPVLRVNDAENALPPIADKRAVSRRKAGRVCLTAIRRCLSKASTRRKSVCESDGLSSTSLPPISQPLTWPAPSVDDSSFFTSASRLGLTRYTSTDYNFISSDDSLRAASAAVFPQLAREHCIDLGHVNKIFAARWLPDDRIVMGTKCNLMLIMDLKKNDAANRNGGDDDDRWHDRAIGKRSRSTARELPYTKLQPLKSSNDSISIEQNCGIHAIDVNPSATLFASGGHNPADVSVFRLPKFEPVTVGEAAHKDWLFDLQWLDDEYLVSGCRDSSLALWRFRDNQEDLIVCPHTRMVKSCGHNVASASSYVGGRCCASSTEMYGCVSYPTSRPVTMRKLQRFDKVRALTFNHRRRVLTSVSLNSYLHILDITTFKEKLLRKIDGYTECVCLCNSPDEDLLTVGSRTSFAFFDTRTWEKVCDARLPRRVEEGSYPVQPAMPSGVRSISWRDSMLTLGTGGGEIMFYDIRNNKFLQCDCNRSLTLKITGGWLQDDEILQELFLNMPCPNAVYAHCYDQYGSRLFAAGGPIAASLVGNYAAMWQ